MDVFSDFIKQMKKKYSSEWGSIYYKKPKSREKIARLAGTQLSQTALNEYLLYDSPKYIISETDTAVRYTRAHSAFIFTIPINGSYYIFFLGSKRYDAYAQDLSYIVRDIINFKMRLQE